MNTDRAFKYSLEALVKKRRWELDIQLAEGARAAQVVEKKRDALDAASEDVLRLEKELRDCSAPEASLELDRYTTLQAFLGEQRERQEEARTALQRAEKVYADIQGQIRSARESLKGLEKHKERKRKDFVAAVYKAELIESDNMWLAHKHRTES